MSSSGIADGNVSGKGVRFPRLASVFIGRVAITAGGIYMLCEDVVTDSSAVTAENSNSDVGSLANVITPTAACCAGIVTSPGGEAGVFVLATETVALGAAFIGLVEGYYVDAAVTTTASRTPRTPLYPLTTLILSNTGTGIGSPAIGRLLQDVGTITATLAKVHFCGLPGGFGNGPGTT